MTNLLPRHVENTEATRLGVEPGWYATKVSGTFVVGPYPSEESCLEKISEIGPVAQDQRI